MTRPKSEWRDVDREAMRLVFAMRDADPRGLSLRAMAREIGVSSPRILDLRDGRHGKPTLEEFCNLCLLFHTDPGTVLRRALQATGE